MGQFKEEFKNVRNDLKDISKGFLFPFKYSLSKKIYHDIKHTPNPVRRKIKYTGWALTTPIIVPIELAVDTSAVGVTVMALSLCALFSIGTLASNGLYDILKWIDDIISLYDEVPNTNQLNRLPVNSENEDIVNSQIQILKSLEFKKPHKELSPYAENYILSFKHKIPYCIQMKNLQLNKEEESIFRSYHL